MRFVCDTMLARVARWLRIIGIEAEYYGTIDDDDLITKRPEGSIILTRDAELAARPEAQPCYLVRAHKIWNQLREIVDAFGIEIDPDRIFSLCPNCGVELKEIEKGKVRGLVPPFVYATIDEFYRCPSCKKIFWEATHTRGIKRILAQTFGRPEQGDGKQDSGGKP